MNSPEVYGWYEQIRKQLPMLGKWQALSLAWFSLGIVLAERCTFSKVAEKLPALGKADTVERRLQRWVANPRLVIQELMVEWVRWVRSCVSSKRLVLLVDETKLGAHLCVMVVGLAYEKCCIPLAWRCYLQEDYPPEGQVALIAALLKIVAAGLPPGERPLLEADRGLGTSPALVQAVSEIGWDYLFRIQKSTRFKCQNGRIHSAESLIKAGESWHGKGWLFKKAGWLPGYLCLHWELGYKEPWCLVTNDPTLRGPEYAVRYWQEASFRDLKSDGWQWQRSRVWLPAHAERLVVVMALAYGWSLTQGTLVEKGDEALRARLTRGRERRYSLFRLGLRYIARARHGLETLLFELRFTLPSPVPKVS